MVTIAEFNPGRALNVTLWTAAGGLSMPYDEDLFLDAAAGAAVFVSQAAAPQSGGGYGLELGSVQAALPPEVGEVEILGTSGEDLTVRVEDPAWGESPVDSLLSVAGVVPSGQSSFSLYGWSRRNTWRIALYTSSGGRVGSGTLGRGAVAQIPIAAMGMIQGSVDWETYPAAGFVLVRDPSAVPISDPDPVLEATLGLEELMSQPGSMISSDGTYSAGGLPPAAYEVELWATMADGVPLATKPASVTGGAAMTVDFP